MTKNDNGGRRRSAPRTLLIVLATLLLYAFAIQVTQIDLEEPIKPRRQENLFELLRELAKPDLFAYESETRSMDVSIRMPCSGEPRGSQVTFEGRLVVLVPNCASTTQDPLLIQGEGFPPHVSGGVLWHPAGSSTPRRLLEFKADENGAFSVDFTMPDIRETEEPQRLEVVEVLSRRIVGLSDTSIEALDKIVETVLMALMASTVGTFLAIPISFMAARNIMRDVKLPLASIMATVILIPVGAIVGWWVAGQLVAVASGIDNSVIHLLILLVTGVASWAVIRARIQPAAPSGRQGNRFLERLGVPAGAILLLIALVALAQVGMQIGSWLSTNLGWLGFIGNFIYVLSDLTSLMLPVVVGFGGILIGSSLGGRYGQEVILRMEDAPARVITALLTVFGAAVFLVVVGMALIWINLLGVRALVSPTLMGQLRLFALPALIFGVIIGWISMLAPPKRHYPIGITTYNATRTVLNGLRSIEPIMMGFVFVVWVGLGPFAGILALTLHSVADLGKLFSEEVENIDEGPREAVTATGADAIQSIVYSVVPQIMPHYIAYIFYRWDINVRMSTIIGFVGGGGIGFVLQRYLNQLQYTRASVMVIAIAIVVSVLDNVSSRIRSRII